MELKTISATSYTSFYTCPQQWKFKYKLKLLQKKSMPLIIGTAYHALLEDFYNGKNEEFSFKERAGHLDEDSQTLLKNMFQKYKDDPVCGNVINNERKFSIEVPGLEPRLIGVIDREDDDKTVEYKTSSKDYKDKDTDTIQPSIYTYARWKDTGKLLPVIFSVNNKKKHKSVKYKPQQIKIEKTEKDMHVLEEKLRTFYKEVQTTDFPPQPGIHCYWCPFGNKTGDGCCPNSK